MASSGPLERAHQAYERRAWDRAYERLVAADRDAPLAIDDLDRLATAAYLTGRADEFLRAYERAHQLALAAGDRHRAARCAFWISLELALRGEIGPANGWITRANRLLDRTGRDSAEKAFLSLLTAEQHLHAGEPEAAQEVSSRAVAIGERFHEPDLIAAARHLAGRALLRMGRVEEGLACLDDAMVAVTAGELSPVMTGLVYCSVIEACQDVFALGRALEWTAALARWCEAQGELVAFTNTCLVRRAEVLQVHGDWPDALREAGRACVRFSDGLDPRPPPAALYQQAEVHRLTGEFDAAERAYREANRWGYDPQPGLSLLRLVQGRPETAAAQIRRALSTMDGALPRTRLLSASVEILMAAGDVAGARTAAEELAKTAAAFDTPPLRAMAAQARGAVELAAGDPRAALNSLRYAWQCWEQVQARYAAARTRVLIGLACRLLGDDEGCSMEIESARRTFRKLGAAPDLARLDDLSPVTTPNRPGGLTPREIEILRLVAAGKTNRRIASDLSISDKTVARHVSNIFTKLGLSTRAAATAYAYEHDLV